MKYKVLIIDDSKLARMAVAKLLSKLHPDWPRIEAANGDEANTALEAEHPDFVLLDFNMPGRNGLELAADFRKLRPSMPVALITANIQQEIVERAKAIGAEFLPKPLTEAALQNYLARATGLLESADA